MSGGEAERPVVTPLLCQLTSVASLAAFQAASHYGNSIGTNRKMGRKKNVRQLLTVLLRVRLPFSGPDYFIADNNDKRQRCSVAPLANIRHVWLPGCQIPCYVQGSSEITFRC